LNFVRYCGLLIAVLTLAPVDLVRPPPKLDPAQRQTLGGALERADRKLEPFTRQNQLDGINVGLWGRINSTRAAVRQDQAVIPGVVDRPLSSW
jgi:hypothetical protein